MNNSLLTGVGVGLQIVLGMIVALLLNMSFRGRSFVRGVIIIPWATPTFVAAFAWIWLLDAQYGIINMVLIKLNILSEGIPWLGQLNTALFCVIIAHVWKGLPWVVMVLLSGLQMVPKSLQEAARVDGANAWKEFWNVIVPSMKNVLLIV
ncbi:MAG: sugar ABC transporter permease, partial [Desulfobulbaceae bacterium]|nr:sugar ABC transporter permease [Desulfobulbaceae bacterium]